MIEDGPVERRGTGEDGDPLRLDAGQDAVHVEDGLGQHRGAAGDTGQDAGLETEHVEVGVHLEVDVAGAQARHGDPVGGHDQGAAVRHDDALGDTGRPRREEDVGGIVRAEGGAAAPYVGHRFRRGPRQEVPPRHGAAARTAMGGHDRLERREGDARVLEHGHVVGAQEVGDGDEHPGPRPGQDVGRLGALEASVHRHEHRAGVEDAEHGDHPLGAVGTPDRHAVAGLDAGRHQGGAEAAGRLDQLGVGEARLPVEHGHPVGEALLRAGEHGRDGRPGRGGRRRRCHRQRGAVPAPGIENDPLSIQ